MNVRVRIEWLIAITLLAGGSAWAQVPPAPGPAAPIQCPPAEAYYNGTASNFAPPPDLYAELLPSDRGGAYDCDSRVDLGIREMLRGTWFRMEYLQGFIQRNDSRVLGTPIVVGDPPPLGGPAEDVVNVANQFLILFADSSDIVDGIGEAYAQVPTTDGVSWHNAQGLRASFGIPILKKAWLETTFVGYMNQKSSLTTPPIPAPSQTAPGVAPAEDSDGNPFPLGSYGNNLTTFLATSITTDGLPGSRLMLYDAGFKSYYDARLKAGNIDLVLNWKTPDLGWRMQPIIGYRHDQYSEQLGFGGTFDNRSGFLDGVGILATPETNWIDSKVVNQRDQIEFGMRNEMAFRFLTLGVQEKCALGSNVVRGTAFTSNLREPGTVPGTINDPEYMGSSDRHVVFAPTFDLDVYAKIRINNWMNFRVGYSLNLLGNLGVADRSLRLNEVSDGAGGTTPDVVSQLRYGHRIISALTVGGEIVLP